MTAEVPEKASVANIWRRHPDFSYPEPSAKHLTDMTATAAGRIDAAERPDGSDLADVLARHQVGVWRYLRFLGASSHLAEDLTQEALIAALGSGVLRELDDRTRRVWLDTTARNFFFTHVRRARRQGGRVDFDVIEPEIAEHAWSWFAGRNSGEADDGTLALQDLDLCLRTVGSRERDVLTQRYHEGLSRKEIGANLELSSAGVKALLRRVRSRLRACIERRRQERGD